MTHINEFGEIIRDKDPNDRSQESISFFEGLVIFVYNYFLFIPGLVLYFNHKKKGYTRKARQVATIMWIEVIFLIIMIIITIAANT
jgi:hypothetical protein